MTFSLTTRYGIINSLFVYQYRYSKGLKSDKQKFDRFHKWFTTSSESGFYMHTSGGFETLFSLQENWQYIFSGKRAVTPPFADIPLISRYLAVWCHSQWIESYKKSGDLYILEEKNAGIFRFVKGFEYNIEVFTDGRFLVHLQFSSRVMLNGNNYSDIISRIRNVHTQNTSKSGKLYFAFGNRKKTINLEKNNWLIHTNSLLEQHPDCELSFDFEFLSNYFPAEFKVAHAFQKNKTRIHVPMLKSASASLVSSENIRLYQDAFLGFKPTTIEPSSNLVIGDKKLVSKLSAIYYSGLFRPVWGWTCLPVINGASQSIADRLRHVIDKNFNAGGEINWLSGVNWSSATEVSNFIRDMQGDRKRLLVIFITGGLVDASVLNQLQKANLKYLTFRESSDSYIMSNFAVKCLERMNGIVSHLKDMSINSSTYFIGIDMGHSHTSKSTTLAVSCYDYHGLHVRNALLEDLPLNEALNKDAVVRAITIIREFLEKYGRALPSQLIFHRDGRMHAADEDTLVTACLEVFHAEHIEIIEIIKSGFPYVVTGDDSDYINPASGTSWILEKYNYAVLITNDQGSATGELLNPLVIKRKKGVLPMSVIVSQVFWLCKVNTTNIYYPSRVPVTVSLANRLART